MSGRGVGWVVVVGRGGWVGGWGEWQSGGGVGVWGEASGVGGYVCGGVVGRREEVRGRGWAVGEVRRWWLGLGG